jgi:EAL domain-containing protein (putative c-di-GMP-specific phosphodiesterase class I)
LVDDDFYVSVNLSPRQLADGAIVENVARDLEDAGLPGSALVLEITESALMENYEAVLARLLELKTMGIRFALDDYGTGYSSLARLSELPIDIIKIDKSFIDNVRTNAETRILVKSVVDVAKALGMATVAEGVEEENQFETLQKLGFTFIQGFLFAQPEPAALAGEVIARLRDSKRGRAKRSRQLSTMG